MSKIVAYIRSKFNSEAREFTILKPGDVEHHHHEGGMNEEEEVPEGQPMVEMTEEWLKQYVTRRLGVSKAKEIGSGAFSKVYLARGKRKQAFAVKIQSAPQNDNKSLVECYKNWDTEIKALEAVSGHKNFAQLVEVLFLKHHTTLAQIPTHVAMKMEYLPLTLTDMNEMDFVSYRGVPQMTKMLVNYLEAIWFLHSKNIVHHDIKSDNIMLATTHSKEQIQKMSHEKRQELLCSVDYKVIDLGLAEHVSGPLSFKSGGSRAFMAPEKVKAGLANNRLGSQTTGYNPFVAEAYSIGCVGVDAVAPIIFSQYLHQYGTAASVPLGKVFKLVVENEQFEFLKDTELLKVMFGLLEFDSSKRLTIEQARNMLKPT